MSAADHVVREPAPWRAFRERQDAGSIPFQACLSCSRAVFYPRVLCPACGSTELEWREASGDGAVYSQSFLPARDGPGHQVVLVDMVEGWRVMGVAESGDLAIGDPVVCRLRADDAHPHSEPQYVFTRREG